MEMSNINLLGSLCFWLQEVYNAIEMKFGWDEIILISVLATGIAVAVAIWDWTVAHSWIWIIFGIIIVFLVVWWILSTRRPKNKKPSNVDRKQMGK